MIRSIILLILGTMSFQLVAQSKIYKWVDENGKVHYSSKPPPEQSKADGQVQVTDLKQEKIMPAQFRNNAFYCGELQILYVSRSNNFQTEVLKRGPKRLEDYQDRLISSEKQFVKNGKNMHSRYRDHQSVVKSQKRLKKQISQYKCAIKWLKEKIDFAKSGKGPRIKKIEGQLARLKQVIQSNCGVEPDKGYLKEDKTRHSKWKRCKSKHSGRLKELTRELEELKKERIEY